MIGNSRPRPVLTKSILLGLIVALATVVFLASGVFSGGATPDCPPCEVPPSEWDRLPPEKRAVQERALKAYQDALEQPENLLDTKADVLHPATPAPWPEGIFETGQAPLSRGFKIENQWQSDLDGSHLRVYAGSLQSDPAQGVIVVLVTSLDFKSEDSGVFLTPTKAGAVRITRTTGQRLQLVSRDGTLFAFEVRARGFVEPEAMPAWPEGIFAFGEAAFPAGQPFPANVFQMRNVWQGESAEDYVRVFAGSYIAVPSQGVVIVQRMPLSLWPDTVRGARSSSIHEPPGMAGGLRITAANDGRIDLITGTGAALAFDLKLNEFVETGPVSQ
jgi:hypothetical protein